MVAGGPDPRRLQAPGVAPMSSGCTTASAAAGVAGNVSTSVRDSVADPAAHQLLVRGLATCQTGRWSVWPGRTTDIICHSVVGARNVAASGRPDHAMRRHIPAVRRLIMSSLIASGVLVSLPHRHEAPAGGRQRTDGSRADVPRLGDVPPAFIGGGSQFPAPLRRRPPARRTTRRLPEPRSRPCQRPARNDVLTGR